MTNIFRDGENSAVNLDDYSADGCGQRYERATSSSWDGLCPALPASLPALPATHSLWSQTGTQLMADGPEETDVKIGMKCVCDWVKQSARERQCEEEKKKVTDDEADRQNSSTL